MLQLSRPLLQYPVQLRSLSPGFRRRFTYAFHLCVFQFALKGVYGNCSLSISPTIVKMGRRDEHSSIDCDLLHSGQRQQPLCLHPSCCISKRHLSSKSHRKVMTTLPAPPKHLLPDIGRKLHADVHRRAKDPSNDTAQVQKPAHELQPFACGLTGTSVEVLEPKQCDVEGSVPSWLQGDLYRNGPGTWDIETKNGTTFSLAHW